VTDPRDTVPDRLEPLPSAGYEDPFEAERERTAAYEQRLAYESEQDRLAQEELARGDEQDLAPPPAERRLPLVTAVLGLLLVAFVFLLAGIELQKLLGPSPAPVPPPAAAEGDDDGLVFGEVIAIRERTLYVREAGGRIVKVRAAPGSRLAVGRPAELSDLRPGQEVVAVARAGEGERTAESITVVPPRERER
jgi:hypothetical protein